jgi:hypothetical protein
MNHSTLLIFIALISVCLGNGSGAWISESTEASSLSTAIRGSMFSIHDSQFKSDAPSSRIGMITRNFTDEKRNNWQGTGPRPLRTAIWYPAAAATRESRNIEFRAEFFNLFNQLNFANPISNLNAASSSGGSLNPNTGQIITPGDFGRINSTSNNPRLTQFALRLNF